MRYVVRVVLGAFLGLLAVVSLGWIGLSWWIGATAGALLALAGFLGSFFVWSADRPEEGYEQVLFDLPNNAVAATMIVAFVGLAFAGGHWLGGASAPAEDAAAALARSQDSQALFILNQYYDPQGPQLDAAATQEAQATVKALQAALAGAPDSEGKASRVQMVDNLAKGLDAWTACGHKAPCLDAQFAFLDAQRAYKALHP